MVAVIQKVAPKQADSLRQLAIKTYRETFSDHIGEADLQTYFRETYAVDRLKEELENPESQVCFIVKDGQTAGFLKINWGQAQTEQKLADSLEIQRIYILEAFQGMGLGKQLFEYGLQEAYRLGCKWVWLGVWEHNYKAQAFYQKYGFEKFSEHAFPTGEQTDVDWLLRKLLK